MKKGQGMPLNVIIIAIIVILVGIVLIAVFNRYITGETGRLESCVAKGGQCKLRVNNVEGSGCNKETEVYLPKTDCEKGTNKDCCLKVLG
ncbi:hypothetical protein KY330_00750 [Candidatus Woesearchaeota archaeon]|nr:hypothetical protein [Candidatus Woesearchaeota archaeon]